MLHCFFQCMDILEFFPRTGGRRELVLKDSRHQERRSVKNIFRRQEPLATPPLGQGYQALAGGRAKTPDLEATLSVLDFIDEVT